MNAKFIMVQPEELKILVQESVNMAIQPLISSQKNVENEDLLITRKEAADLLHFSLTTLHTYLKQGLLVRYKVGHRVLYKKSEITASLGVIKSIKFKSKN